jgi:hypothetical protein
MFLLAARDDNVVASEQIFATEQLALHDQAQRFGAGAVDLPFDHRSAGGRLWASANVPRGAIFQFTVVEGWIDRRTGSDE